ncbi:MAG TPA: hypothetical protein VHP56_00905 [Solirubrobacterales bacterium]|nr:hypothetical protein [Solirubrobacterales bacterium]
MGPVRISRRRLAAAFPLALVAALATLALGGAASASAAACPSFKVLHDDRIGAVVLPAGSYEVTVSGGLSCPASSKLFARFLSDWDGNLPKPWRATAEGSGKATFTGGVQGFSVRRVSGGGEGGGGGNTELGKLCAGTFTVNAGSDVGPLYFAKGPYLVYVPAQSAISCRRASVLFTRFLAAPGGMLPDPWQVMTQTATFFKPAHPLRSAFRLEPAGGVS